MTHTTSSWLLAAGVGVKLINMVYNYVFLIFFLFINFKMAQVISSIFESGKYTITIKPSLINKNLKIDNNVMKNLSRYTVPNNIVNIIKNLMFKEFQLTPDKKYTQSEQIQLFVSFNACENVPQICDNYNSTLPSYVYVNLSDDKSILNKIYAIENNIDYDGFSPLNIPKDYNFKIDPCPTGFTCVGEGWKVLGDTSGIVFYSSSLVLIIISMSVLSSILTVNMNNGFNAVTVILLMLLLASLSICIMNIYKIYTLKQDLSKIK